MAPDLDVPHTDVIYIVKANIINLSRTVMLADICKAANNCNGKYLSRHIVNKKFQCRKQ